MSVTITVQITAAASDATAVLQELASALPVTRQRHGCRRVDTLRSEDNPRLVTLLEEWDERAQFEAYIAWRQSTGDLGRLLALTEAGAGIRTEFWQLRPE